MPLKKGTPESPGGTDRRRNSRDTEGLLQQLQQADPAKRRWAARDLAGCPAASDALMARLAVEDDLSVREAIFTSLTQIGDSRAVDGLAHCLSSDDAQLRNEAIEAMKALPTEVATIMTELLHREDPDVRILAINVLESLRHPDVEKWLIDVIEHDPVLNVCGCALDLLTEVGTEGSRGALEFVRRRFAGEPYVQFVAGLALKRLDKA